MNKISPQYKYHPARYVFQARPLIYEAADQWRIEAEI